jgi:hypothetical protein
LVTTTSSPPPGLLTDSRAARSRADVISSALTATGSRSSSYVSSSASPA